ncbi:hypothetical protein QE611_04130 [Streptococcus suis]|uniref:hypothetical protein n=1 Tax=Streptococcus suis TaxID=1307 RepID=UPI003757C311
MTVGDIHFLSANINRDSESIVTLEIDFLTGGVSYTSFINTEIDEETYFVSPYHELALFKQELEACGLLEWKRTYPNPKQGPEGKQWYVEYIMDGQLIQINGHDHYPNNWERFCQAVETLTKCSFR